ncbi:MAG: hypothetical protein GH151_01990 [Bacteroidetes bacterium]|nr:hypothetical protein [Bacteroidota bacterium]
MNSFHNLDDACFPLVTNVSLFENNYTIINKSKSFLKYDIRNKYQEKNDKKEF